MRRILMIAFHFPPLAGSSGIQRTLRFVQHLPAHGWQPIVLSAHPRAYERCGEDLLADIPPDVHVERAFALDSSRHLAIKGRYAAATARPDRWVSWSLGAIPAGLRLIRKYRPDVIWSTYPIATAHIIGHALNRLTGIPWIADFRDPMAQDGYPEDPATHASFERIEQKTFARAAKVTVTTPGTKRLYAQRFPHASERIELIENGYDEETFAGLSVNPAPLVAGKILLLHSGIVYPEERDPRPLFDAIQRLRLAAPALAERLVLRLRAPVHEQFLRQEISSRGLSECVEIAPPVPYREALEEMMRADGLLIMQSAGCNDQIPAKLYEYLRATRPIIGLTDPAGDTWQTLSQAGVDMLARLDSSTDIATQIERFLLMALSSNNAHLASPEAVAACSRAGRAASLARLLDKLPI